MKTSRIMLTADWHLGSLREAYKIGKGDITNREEDLNRQVQTMIKYCIDNSIATVFIAGDMFDKSYVDGRWFSIGIDYIKKFAENYIEVVVITGNHEWIESGSPLLNVFEKLKEIGVEVVSLPRHVDIVDAKKNSIFCIPHVTKDIIGKRSFDEYVNEVLNGVDSRILIGHFQVDGSVPGSEEEMFAGSSRIVKASTLFRGRKDRLVFAGHVHRPQLFKDIYVIGSPVMFGVKERDDEKRFLVCDTVSGDVESVRLNCQKYYKINIDLVGKDTFSLEQSRLKRYKGSVVGISIVSIRENKAQIDWSFIIEKFDEVGAKVISKKVKFIKKEVLEKSKDIASFSPISVFVRIVNSIVKGKDNKKRISEMGARILEEIRSGR